MLDLEATLFCGISLNSELNQWLEKLPSHDFNRLLDKNSGYLQKIEFRDGIYIGKWVGQNCSYQDIEQIEQNIHSVFKRFFSEYNPQNNPIFLLSGQKSS